MLTVFSLDMLEFLSIIFHCETVQENTPGTWFAVRSGMKILFCTLVLSLASLSLSSALASSFTPQNSEGTVSVSKDLNPREWQSEKITVIEKHYKAYKYCTLRLGDLVQGTTKTKFLQKNSEVPMVLRKGTVLSLNTDKSSTGTEETPGDIWVSSHKSTQTEFLLRCYSNHKNEYVGLNEPDKELVDLMQEAMPEYIYGANGGTKTVQSLAEETFNFNLKKKTAIEFR